MSSHACSHAQDNPSGNKKNQLLFLLLFVFSHARSHAQDDPSRNQKKQLLFLLLFFFSHACSHAQDDPSGNKKKAAVVFLLFVFPLMRVVMHRMTPADTLTSRLLAATTFNHASTVWGYRL